jgi:hypothetical protein
MNNLAAIVAKIREHSEIPILIYNLSPIIPGDQIHCYAGLGETFASRIHKFNLALEQLSENSGISIIDVDTVVARHGADALKLEAARLLAGGQGSGARARRPRRVGYGDTMSVRASVISRSKDEADRLRLTLTSLACQSEPPEVVVVNDGSSDHTKDVIATAEGVNIPGDPSPLSPAQPARWHMSRMLASETVR